ncbi:hypothetical protein AWE95_23510 [Escherichia coli]|nr:hypothetical protein AWE95_23510 [Escherichia coli]
MCGIFQILTVAVFLFALDVIGVVCSLPLATKFNAEVIGCHGFSPLQERTYMFLDEGEKHISALPSNFTN